MKTEKHRLSSEAIANKRRYDSEYLKEYYTYFTFHISKEEAKKFNDILKEKKLRKIDFLRQAFTLLEKDKFDV